MCGIVGMAGDLSIDDRRILKDLLDVCQVRGRDSTGVIKVDRQLDYGYVKRVGAPAYLFDTREYDKLVDTGLAAVYIGHTRARTVGDVSTATAHPFDIHEKQICGVHNGTLRSYHAFPEHKAGQVDSLTLYERLANLGPTKTFGDLFGAWACVWWDDAAKSLNFIRNDERPLCFTFSKDKRKMFWASEPWMLEVVERRMDLWGGDKTRDVIFPLTVDHHFEVIVDPAAKDNDDVITIAHSEKIPRKVPPPPPPKQVGGSVASPFSHWGDHLPQLLTQSAQPNKKTEGTATKPTTTPPSTKNSSTPSNNLSARLKRLKCLVNGSASTLSPPSTSSDSSQKTKRKNKSDAPVKPLRVSSNSLVDLRYIAALDTWYITNRKTGREVTEQRFAEETGNVCSFCQETVNNLSQVARIISPTSFLCTSCAQMEIAT